MALSHRARPHLQTEPAGNVREQPTRTLSSSRKPDNTIVETSSEQGQLKRCPKILSTRKNGGKKEVQGNSAFRFMVVEHPDQLKDKAQMRKNRMHVMYDYLHKEAQNPNSADTRIQSYSKAAEKRKQSCRESLPATDEPFNASPTTSASRRHILHPIPADQLHRHSNPQETSNQEKNRRRVKSTRMFMPETDAESDLTPLTLIYPTKAAKGGSLGEGIDCYSEYSRYLGATVHEVPFLGQSARLGDSIASSLEPFGAWPSFPDPSIDLNALKWHCALRFGSESMTTVWLPLILRARHAFLSTLCMSSAHEDIMTRALVPVHVHNNKTLQSRWRVRSGTIQMINDSLSDPLMRIADETIIAIIHVLHGEIMGCNDEAMRIHQQGLHTMVRERGGLLQLGASGHIAVILTISNYLIGALREVSPHRDFVEYASKNAPMFPNKTQRFPESPIYCRPQGYVHLNEGSRLDHKTYHLLEMVRRLTNAFYMENGARSHGVPSSSTTTESWNDSDESVSSLRDKIFAIRPAADGDYIGGLHARYQFESIRLTSLVYAHAMANKIPFSKAAAQLGVICPLNIRQEQPKSISMQIRDALIRTDTSFCWGRSIGIMFWVTLIAGAAANPGPLAHEDRVGEEEDVRKWLAAVAVRCCVMLHFQYGSSIMETLRRVVAVETVLAQGGDGEDGFVDASSASLATNIGYEIAGSPIFGPEQTPLMHQGLADFGWDTAF